MGFSKYLNLVPACALLLSPVYSVYIFATPGDLPTTIPAACRAALSTNITCSELLPASSVAQQTPPTADELTNLCTTNCSASLASFQKNVQARCTAPLVYNNYTTTGSALVDPLAWAFNVTCLKDTSGFCLPRIFNGTVGVCSDCFLKYEAAMLGSPYGQNVVNPVAFSSVLSSCSVPASKYPYTTPTSTSAVTTATTSIAAAPTCTGSKYVVKSGDSCISIAAANSVATDRLLADNSLDFNCTSLKVGASLCIQNPCKLQVVKQGDTCNTFLAGQTFFLEQFLSWNPVIHERCDNLDVLVGRGVCISPPGATTWTATPSSTQLPTVPLTIFPSSFVTGAAATTTYNFTTTYVVPTTVSIPPPTTFDATNSTYISTWNQRTQYCPILGTDWENGWTTGDLPDGCFDLIYPYCFPAVTGPAPTSTRFPAVCSPAYYATAT